CNLLRSGCIIHASINTALQQYHSIRDLRYSAFWVCCSVPSTSDLAGCGSVHTANNNLSI
ncbi:hypothetical protein LLE87_35635, partial [Paenibacillus polymyxa]|nr:hypothetical protein [Paenibacillus polymyxa]